MKTINRLVCLLLCVCILGCMVLPAFAEEENSEQSLTPYQDEYGYINEEELLGTDELVEYIPSRAADDYRAWAQADSRWGSILMGSSGITIASEGCLVTSITKLIIQSGLRDENSFNVGTFATWLNNHNGYTGNALLYWDKPSECVSGFSNYGTLVSYGSYSSSGNNSQILGWISSGYHMTINVNNGGHWVAVDEAKSLATGQIYIMDSLSGVANADITLVSRYSTFNQIHAYKGGSTPQGNKPGKPSLKNFARSYAHGATTVFNWDSTANTTHYNLYIDRLQSNGDWEVDYRVWHYAISGFSAGFDDGIYRVLLQATNADADGWPYTNSDYVSFVVGSHTHNKGTYVFYEADHPHYNCYECSYCGQIWRDTSSSNELENCYYCQKPGKPALKGMKSVYANGETTFFIWDDIPKATHYNLYIDRLQSDGEWEIDYRVWHYAISGFSAGFDDGTYRVLLQATNSNWAGEDGTGWAYTNGDYITFVVTPATVTVTFDPNGGSVSPTTKTVTIGSTYGTLPTPTRTYYNFDGWYTSASGGSKVTESTTVTATSNHTLYAHWTHVCANGHNYSYSVSAAPTTSAAGTLTGTCSRCGASTTIMLPKLTTNDYNYSIIQAATCTSNGTGRYTWKTTTYGTFSFDVTIPKTGHSYTDTVTPPTCTEQGYTTHTCSVCGSSYVDSYVNALAHDWDEGVVTVQPTDSKDGEKRFTCARCQETYTEILPKLNRENPFLDVGTSNWFYDQVLWAYYHDPQITSGTDAMHFSPNVGCTREQIVTFLWAANGKPEPEGTGTAFSDVASDTWYYKPVQWAVENGYTSGMGDGSFGVGQSCTRAQAMTFLYAAAGKPTDFAMPETAFSDVAEGDWFYTPVMWALSKGITAGMGNGVFGASSTCTRAQIVTFLYKAYGEE